MERYQRTIGQLGIVILCSLGLLSTPVECALAVGPHSIYHTPTADTPGSSHVSHTAAHHHSSTNKDVHPDARAVSPGAEAIYLRMATYAGIDPVCLNQGQLVATPVRQLAQVTAPADGSAPVSVTNREARVDSSTLPGVTSGFSRLLASWHVGQPCSDALNLPDTPPPRAAS